jgi:hypothetical protein
MKVSSKKHKKKRNVAESLGISSEEKQEIADSIGNSLVQIAAVLIVQLTSAIVVGIKKLFGLCVKQKDEKAEPPPPPNDASHKEEEEQDKQ